MLTVTYGRTPGGTVFEDGQKSPALQSASRRSVVFSGVQRDSSVSDFSAMCTIRVLAVAAITPDIMSGGWRISTTVGFGCYGACPRARPAGVRLRGGCLSVHHPRGQPARHGTGACLSYPSAVRNGLRSPQSPLLHWR